MKMKMKKLSFFLVVLLFVGFTSCDEVENLNKDKFTFTMDGESFDYSDKADYGTLELTGAKIIRGRKTDSLGLIIYVPEFKETRYTSATDDVSITYNTENNVYMLTDSIGSMEVDIDSYEKGKRIEGTFSATLVKLVGEGSIEIKDGEFRVNN